MSITVVPFGGPPQKPEFFADLMEAMNRAKSPGERTPKRIRPIWRGSRSRMRGDAVITGCYDIGPIQNTTAIRARNHHYRAPSYMRLFHPGARCMPRTNIPELTVRDMAPDADRAMQIGTAPATRSYSERGKHIDNWRGRLQEEGHERGAMTKRARNGLLIQSFISTTKGVRHR